MHGWLHRWAAVAGLVLALQGGAAADAPLAADAAAGQALYREGLRSGGERLQATVQRGVALSGPQAACVNCHRRSGLGGSEGTSRIRPIAGRLLFGTDRSELARRWAVAEPDAGRRPPYDLARLARALREGVDPEGRRLDPLMPRYDLTDAEVAQLHAYLQTLSAQPAPGVTAGEIHFATVIAPDASPARREALLEVLQAWFRDRNSGTRQEVRRRAVGTERMYLAWRQWVLHAWTLSGPPEDWARQLDAHYARQPVFAVLGGLGGRHWQPVHAFCEARELPCVFPDVDVPPPDGAGYQSLYFSRGVAQEAEVLVRHLAPAPADHVAQLVHDDERGRAAAAALRSALRAYGVAVADHRWPEGVGEAAAARLPAAEHLVAWGVPAELRALFAAPPPPGLRTLYLSGLMVNESELQALVPDPWRERVRLVSLFAPGDRTAHLARLIAWLRLRGLPQGEARTRANAFFAASVAGEALAHLGDNFSRDYFVERIEQMAGAAAAPSAYPRLSLGPGQRIGSRGGNVLVLQGQLEMTPVVGHDADQRQ